MTCGKNQGDENIHISGTGISDGVREITITGFKEDELAIMEGAILTGHVWVRVVKGRLEKNPSWSPLPDPIEDTEMYPFWRKPTQNEKEKGLKSFKFGVIPNHSFPSISIESLCGYHYTPENYGVMARRLAEYGFVCYRTQRNESGMFGEVWHLCGLITAKGDLLKRIDQIKDEKRQLAAALDFLADNVVFGSLDVSVQRLAMQVPD